MHTQPTYEDLQKQVKALEKKERMYRHLYETAMVGIYRTRIEDGKCLAANRALAELIGFDSVEQCIEEFVVSGHYTDPERRKELLRMLRVHGRVEDFEVEIIRKDGSLAQVAISAAAFPEQGYLEGIVIDITGRKLAEKQLRESEERYRSLFKNNHSIMLLIDPETAGIEDANPAAVEFYGWNRRELTGMKITDINTQSKRQVFEEMERAKTEKRNHFRFRHRLANGKIRDVEVYSGPIKLKGRELLYSIIHDISESKQAEAALRESEEKYRQLVRFAPTGIYEIDYIKEKIISANDVMCNFSGYAHDELVSMSPLKLLAEASQKIYLKRLAKLLAGEKVPANVELKFRRKDGREVWALLNVKFTYEDGRLARGTIVAHDINDRKLSEEALRESEEKYRTVLEANPDPVVVYDMAGRVIYFNPAFTRVFGWTLEERMGKKMELFVPPESRDETRTMIQKLKSGESFSGVESKRYTKAGNVIRVSLSGAAYRDRNGKPIGSIINLRDISRQKLIEEQLLHSRKMEAIGTLAGGIAHDFNNLLMGIQGRTSLGMAELDPSTPHFKHLEMIAQYAENAADLTRQLLAFARGGKYEVKPTDLNELVRKTAEMFGRTKKEIIIHTKHQKGIWVVEADQNQIEQVLLNLYVNAWQSMPGGGRMHIETQNVNVDDASAEARGTGPGRYVKISVTDAGVGMDKATRGKIFDPFYTTREMGRGAGLGLASAYGIIQNHGGTIDVDSQKGRGSTFKIFLPASDRKAPGKKEPVKDVPRGSETVLLVDDEEMIVDVCRQLLEKMGYSVLIASSGKAAVELYRAKKEDIDVVILDMIMPDMGGGDTYDMLKAINPRIKVLLSSGYSIDGQASEIIERGCNGFLQKPFNMKNLSEKLRSVLERE